MSATQTEDGKLVLCYSSPLFVLLMALVNLFVARLLAVNDVRYLFVVDSFAFVVRAEFQVGVFTLSFSCISPPKWISSHLLNQGLLSLLGPSFASEIGPETQTMNKHVSEASKK